MERRYGQLYARFCWRRGDDGDLLQIQPCIYCGTAASDRDHVPPLLWVYCLGTEYFTRKGIELLLVPSCRECNSELSSKKLFTLRERTLHLLGRYTKKYEKFLKGEKWEKEEIDEFGRGLKPKIESFAVVQLAIDRRVQILEENLRTPRV